MSTGNMNLTLKVWRQKNAITKGAFVTYKAEGISPDMSFLEMLDVVNESLILKGEEAINFDHDCREGICGCVRCISTGTRTGRNMLLPPASCTCALFMTAKPS